MWGPTVPDPQYACAYHTHAACDIRPAALDHGSCVSGAFPGTLKGTKASGSEVHVPSVLSLHSPMACIARTVMHMHPAPLRTPSGLAGPMPSEREVYAPSALSWSSPHGLHFQDRDAHAPNTLAHTQ